MNWNEMLFTVAGSEPAEQPQAARKPSPKQARVLEYVRANGQITLQQGVDLIGTDIYANACKHVGVTLANMVRRGMLVSIKKGIFTLPNTSTK